MSCPQAADSDMNDIVASLVARMTLEEKVSLLAGRDFWSTMPIERLGVPSLRLSDGPTGLRSTNSDPATVFPVATALAATWNTQLVGRVAGAIGGEALHHEVDILLAPGINIQRTPLGGRNFEYYSEDPHLAAEIGIAFVNGVQSMGVGTSLKHYAANNQEHNRMTVSANVGERALREIYLSAFEPVIKQAQPWTVMCAYNKINGTHAAEHDELLNVILKDEWNWDGVVVSDWGATKSTIGSAVGGLDLEMPGPAKFYGEALLKAIHSGQVDEEIINQAASRMIRLIKRCRPDFGPLDKAKAEPHGNNHRAIAREAAAEAMVLLKNDSATLPLDAPKSLAVIGALADAPAIQGSGSSQVTPERVITQLDGLRSAFADKTVIRFERGIDIEPKTPSVDMRLFRPSLDTRETGLSVRYFENDALAGEPALEKVDTNLTKLGFGAEVQTRDDASFSAEWTGYFTPRYSGEHSWEVSHSNPEVELVLEDTTYVGKDSPRESELLFMILPLNKRNFAIDMEAGRPYRFKLRYSQPQDGAILGFNILDIAMREPAPNREDAIVAVQEAERSIVFVGPGKTAETEGEDRTSMALCDEQNALVADILDHDSDAIIVVNSGGPIEMPWASRAKTILLIWMPGQEGGHALTDIMTGKVSPSGKLPTTFPENYRDNPTFLHYPGGQEAEYEEGLFVGYRHYDRDIVEPLFPFGFGLSYTQFDYGELRLTTPATTEGAVELAIEIYNSGAYSGKETVQFYVEDLAADDASCVRQLRGFEKVDLAAGECTEIRVTLPIRAFSRWDADASKWILAPGHYRIYAAASSRDLRQSVTVELS